MHRRTVHRRTAHRRTVDWRTVDWRRGPVAGLVVIGEHRYLRFNGGRGDDHVPP